jgi:hypothetical protein
MMNREAEVQKKAKDPSDDTDEDDDGEDPPAKKARKQKEVYGTVSDVLKNELTSKNAGVIAERWHTKKKSRPEAKALIAKTNEELDFEKREKVYEDNREELTIEFK